MVSTRQWLRKATEGKIRDKTRASEAMGKRGRYRKREQWQSSDHCLEAHSGSKEKGERRMFPKANAKSGLRGSGLRVAWHCIVLHGVIIDPCFVFYSCELTTKEARLLRSQTRPLTATSRPALVPLQ